MNRLRELPMCLLNSKREQQKLRAINANANTNQIDNMQRTHICIWFFIRNQRIVDIEFYICMLLCVNDFRFIFSHSHQNSLSLSLAQSATILPLTFIPNLSVLWQFSICRFHFCSKWKVLVYFKWFIKMKVSVAIHVHFIFTMTGILFRIFSEHLIIIDMNINWLIKLTVVKINVSKKVTTKIGSLWCTGIDVFTANYVHCVKWTETE